MCVCVCACACVCVYVCECASVCACVCVCESLHCTNLFLAIIYVFTIGHNGLIAVSRDLLISDSLH